MITILSSIIIPWLLLKFWFPDFYLLKRKPNLIKGLPSEIAIAEEKFALRVQKLFPPNTLDTEIERELSKQGFEIKTVRGKKIASFEMHNVFCRLEYLIDWEVNDRNEIYNLNSLSELNIKSIKLSYSNANTANAGNAIKQTSTYELVTYGYNFDTS